MSSGGPASDGTARNGSPDGPAVLCLGGSANALSIGRSLGRQGVRVHLSQPRGRPEQRSRWFARTFLFEPGASAAEYWRGLLAGDELAGCVLFACDDEAIDFLARERAALDGRYLLDDSTPELQLALLDKRRTLELAARAGVPAPRLWQPATRAEAERLLSEIAFPAIVKPVHSHLFQRVFGSKGRKFFLVERPEELAERLETALDAGIDVIVVEKIPGPDDALGSYYTYVTADGRRLFRYTKKIVRRFPKNEGLACCHRSEWDAEIAEVGERFFERIGFRGFGNVEFKRDPRDGVLKLIECNARFTAAQELLVRCGMDVARIVYNHLTGLPVPRIDSYREGLMYWYPLRDVRAFRELRSAGELSFATWVKSLMHPTAFPYWSLSDPLPCLHALAASLTKSKH